MIGNRSGRSADGVSGVDAGADAGGGPGGRSSAHHPAPCPDLARPPFADGAGDTPAEVAEHIVACFRRISRVEGRTRFVCDAAMQSTGLESQDPWVVAGSRIATAIDQAIDSAAGMAGNAYHNSQHVCEVLLSALFLAKHHGLDARRQVRLVLAALAHDFGHDGSAAEGPAFRLELMAVDATRPYLVAAGVAEAEIEPLDCLVLATEFVTGAPFARACFRHLHLGEPAPTTPANPAPLAQLLTDADLAFDAVLLTEADLLPSMALTFEHAMLCQERLSREDRRIAPGLAAKQAFLERQSGFLVGQFFEPRRAEVRQAVAAALARQDGS